MVQSSVKKSIDDQIKELENELSTTKYNKRTQHHIGLVKAKIANLRDKAEQRSKSVSKHTGYSVRKTGDGTVALLGFPSVGKSTLLNGLTNAESAVGAYAFTTLTVVPGLLEYNHAKIQILDVPGILRGAAAGTGRGKEVLQVLRSSDMIVILLDVFHPEHYEVLLKEIYDTGIRINQKKPDVRIKRTSRGGVRIGKTVKLDVKDETIVAILKEFKISNADVLIRSKITEDQVIDVIRQNCVYLPSINVVNKADMVEDSEVKKVVKKVNADIAISAHKRENLEALKKLIFDRLELMRIYCKDIGKKADLEEPLIIFKDATIEDMCNKLHRDFVKRFRFARIWGESAKFDGQMLRKIKHVLKDEDIVELHLI